MSDEQKRRLVEIALLQRQLGRQEFRIAAMRWLRDRAYANLAKELGNMDVDRYLTPQELAERDKMP